MVSIILCCYNTEKYLASAIESVLSQDFKTFELIFVNDGSTDNSLMIAESFSKNDARIRLFSRPNGGLNSARNYGAKRAADNSEALLFFDADDILEKNMIASLYHELKSGSNVGAAYCNYKCVDTNGIKLKKENNSRRLIPTKFWFKDLPIAEKTTPFFSIYSWSSMGEPWTLIKKELFFKYGGWDEINFPKGDTYGESIPLFGEIALYHKLIYVNEELYLYRKHGNQITSGDFNNKAIQKKIDRIMANKSYQSLEIKHQVEKAIQIVRYRLPLFNYINGLMKHELRHKPFAAFKKLVLNAALYFYSLRY